MAFRRTLIRFLSKNEKVFIISKQVRMKLLMFFGKIIPDKLYITIQYRMRLGKKMNWSHPVLFNEKIQYSKLYYHDERLKKLVDKYEVRDYVSNTIGEKYLTLLYGVYNKIEDVPFELLPEKFVMKLTNGSSYNYICPQKSDKTKDELLFRFKKWISIDFFVLGREWAYKDVPNRIICEEYLETDEEYGLNDYKIFCFNGVPKIIQVDFSRFVNHRRNLYTPNWEFINEKVEYENDPNANIPKPQKLDEMLDCAKKLSKGFPQVRVDFYEIGERLIFGEMTFYHGAGYLKFNNPSFEKQMGDYWCE